MKKFLFTKRFQAEVEATAGGAATTEAVAEVAKATRAPAANFLPIVRGRLPLIFVHALRFNAVLLAMGNKDLGTKFATSVGKVFDIRKGRNFEYIKADWKPTAADVASAEAWIAQAGTANSKGLTALGDKSLMQSTLDEYKSAGLASAEQVAAQAAVKPAKAPRAAKAKTETVAAGTPAGAASTEDLLG